MEEKSPQVATTLTTLDALEIKEIEPPKPKIIIPDYDTTKWVELTSLDASIILDLKYATMDNFVKEQLYDCGRCFLRHEAASQLVKVHQSLQAEGYGLKMLDCFRPLPIQQRLWDKFQNASYVTPPSKGSMHNRGLAVDLTIVDGTGKELDMGTAFDFFGKEAHHTHTGFSDTILSNRALLKSNMEKAGFKPIRTEWWHYSYPEKMYELSAMIWNCDTKE
jgi:D-alanyl-D-alanine dipeptidase